MYLVKFIPGFTQIALEQLDKARARIISAEEDIAIFQTKRQPDFLWSNRLYRVLGSYNARNMGELLHAAVRDGRWPAVLRGIAKGGTFRIQCLERDRLVKPDARNLRALEEAACRAGLSPHRACARNELRLWLRDGGRGLFIMGLNKPSSYEKKLPQGALRPDLCHMLCVIADIRQGDKCADPFCGHGTIPRAMLHYGPSAITAADSNPLALEGLRGIKDILPLTRDALSAPPQERYDAIVTDPPWGRYHDALSPDYMAALFALFARQLSPGGRLVLFLERSMRVENLARNAGLILDAGYQAVYSGNKVKVLRFIAP